MKMLMIVARDSMVKELEELLHANGITAYSVIHKVEGRGQTGIAGTFHYNVYTGSTHFNLMILAVLAVRWRGPALTAVRPRSTRVAPALRASRMPPSSSATSQRPR